MFTPTAVCLSPTSQTIFEMSVQSAGVTTLKGNTSYCYFSSVKSESNVNKKDKKEQFFQHFTF